MTESLTGPGPGTDPEPVAESESVTGPGTVSAPPAGRPRP